MSALRFKVYAGTELYAATRYAEDAAALLHGLSLPARVKVNGRVVFSMRTEEDRAFVANSFDATAEAMNNAMHRHRRQALERAIQRVAAREQRP